MTTSHEDANARLLDLVYGEAPPAERADLEAHVAGCARCQADLAALGGTRAFVRAALVEQAAPKGVHARLLAAATEAVAPVAAARGVPAVVAAPAPAARARAGTPSEARSFWQRMRRGWTVPTFATVGAFAILLLASKVFLSPERTYERGHEGIIPPSQPAPAPAASARDLEGAPADKPASVAAAAAPEEAQADDSSSADIRRRALGDARAHAIGKTLEKSRRHEHGSDGLAGLLDGSRADEGFGTGAARGSAGVGSLGRVGGGSGAVGAGAFASPPTGWKGGAPASPAPAPAGAKKDVQKDVADELDRAAPSASTADRKVAEESLEEREAPARAKAEKVAAPEPLAEKKKAAPAVAKPERASPSAVASAEAQAPGRNAPARDDADATGAAPSPEALARRAEQLYAAHRWDEAAAAYRELVRRYPAAAPVAKWRARLAEAEHASAAAVASRAKESTKESAKKPAKESSKASDAPAGAPAERR